MKKVCIDCGYNYAMKYRKICSACKSRRYRIANPIKSAYDTLKGHAKARNKEFTLTLEYFTKLCVKTDYINKRGTGKHSYHIDRKDETKGYTNDNVQVLENTENIKKYIAFAYIDVDNKPTFTTVTIRPTEIPDEEDLPF